jgi:hypothetical protein
MPSLLERQFRLYLGFNQRYMRHCTIFTTAHDAHGTLARDRLISTEHEAYLVYAVPRHLVCIF